MRNVIVGVDGTAASLGALAWAAETVGERGRIHAVVAVNPWTEYVVDVVTGDPVTYRDVIETALAEQWTRDAASAVGELATTVSIAPMSTALDRAARDDAADAIVIGTHHGIAALGSVVKRIGHSTNQLLRRTVHPVVVVPSAPASIRPLEHGNVVVGIGHGDATRSAVRWAAHLARDRDITIELLHSTGDAPVFQADGVLDLVRYEAGRGDQASWEVGHVEHFAELMQTLSGDELDIVVSTPPGLAALRLDEASERSSLLVIGRHRSRLDGGRHTAQPLRHALTHASCPVAVIADHPADDPVSVC
ncbi:universal stress protein [Ilumatobacter coccineus]|nr:universal stress protein [Ilumatobacter coccineus]